MNSRLLTFVEHVLRLWCGFLYLYALHYRYVGKIKAFLTG